MTHEDIQANVSPGSSHAIAPQQCTFLSDAVIASFPSHPPPTHDLWAYDPSQGRDSSLPLPSLDPPEIYQQVEDATGPLKAFPRESLSTVFRHSGWRPTRNKVYHAMQRTNVSASRQRAFAECGSHAYVLMSRDTPPVYRLAGSTCHDRFCVPCANQRSRTIAMNVIDHMDKKPCRFITLTLRSGAEPLAVLMDRLINAFAHLRRRAPWRLHVTGGVGFIEVKWSARGQRWHPHMHLLVKGSYFKHRTLSREWQHVTGDSNIVDIRPVPSTDQATKYVTKYASKPCLSTFIHDDALLDEAILAIQGRRLVLTFGSWRGVMLTPKPDEDAWINMGGFDTLVRHAKDGDDVAYEALVYVVGQAVADYLSLVRARPPDPDISTPNIAQMDFLDWTNPREHFDCG